MPSPGVGTGINDVAEDDAGLDRRELSGVADQDQPRLGAHRLDQSRHQRQRHHRGLVDDHDVVRQAVAAVVREPAVAPGPPPEQPVQRRCAQRHQELSDRLANRELRGLVVDCLLESRGRLAGRRGQRDQRRPGWVGTGCSGLLDQLRDHPSDSRRLAGTGAAGDHLEPATRLQLVQVGGDRALLAPVAVEVEASAEQSQRPRRVVLTAGNEVAVPERSYPLLGFRPGQLRQVDRLVRLDARGVADRGQVDEHVAEPRAAHGERDREPHGLAVLAHQLARAARRRARPPPTAPRCR